MDKLYILRFRFASNTRDCVTLKAKSFAAAYRQAKSYVKSRNIEIIGLNLV